MKFQLISVRLGKSADKILKAYPKIENELSFTAVGDELFVIIDNIKELTNVIKQNIIVCHDEDVIHIYDAKLR